MATAKKSTKATTAKAVSKPSVAALKKAATKKPAAKKVTSNKVDYYPNRMAFWVSAAAGSLLVLIVVICVYNR